MSSMSNVIRDCPQTKPIRCHGRFFHSPTARKTRPVKCPLLAVTAAIRDLLFPASLGYASMTIQSFLHTRGPEIEDHEEESFLLFSQSIPSHNLGFVDPQAARLELTIGNRDLSIHQSPTILSSNRGGGTTGAVVWKITPLFASWITSPANVLFRHDVLDSNSAVLELGCGISGIIGLVLAPRIKSYVLTDQGYVMKLLNENLGENQRSESSSSKNRKDRARPKRGSASVAASRQGESNIFARPLDWETDEVTASITGSNSSQSFDAVIACDCIYNDALIAPLVQTCSDLCKFRSSETAGSQRPTVCIVAQQLRSSEVFEAWLKEFCKAFRVWRVPDEELTDGLKSGSGFVIHIGILK